MLTAGAGKPANSWLSRFLVSFDQVANSSWWSLLGAPSDAHATMLARKVPTYAQLRSHQWINFSAEISIKMGL
jgi:hypothetical protein